MLPTIRCARAAQEGSIYIYGLAERDDGDGWSLVFSVDEAANEGYALSTSSGLTWYDALEGWALTDHVLGLALTAEAASALGLPGEMRLRIDTRLVDVAELRAAMARFYDPSSHARPAS
jgi:hypothetical protein